MKKTEKTYTKTEEKKRDTLVNVRAARNIVTSSGDDKNIITASENGIETISEAYTREYLQNVIENAIDAYTERYNIDVLSISQRQWNHTLKYIYENAIKPLRIDYRNVIVLNMLVDIYLSLTALYNKSSSVYGFCIYIGIPYTTLINNKYSSNNQIKDVYIDTTNNKVLDSIEIDIYKQLHKESVIVKSSKDIYTDIIKKIESDREHALTDQAENGSVMSLALGKIQYGWIESAKEKIQVEMLENYRLPGDLLSKYSDN